jgi:hypothetical protein
MTTCPRRMVWKGTHATRLNTEAEKSSVRDGGKFVWSAAKRDVKGLTDLAWRASHRLLGAGVHMQRAGGPGSRSLTGAISCCCSSMMGVSVQSDENRRLPVVV